MAPRKAFPLRINPELYKDLAGWAQDEFRSVNSQIEFLLRQAVQRRKSSRAAKTPSEEPPLPGESEA